MQCQEKETMFDFEKYSHYLLVEVKFNGAGTTVNHQVENFLKAFEGEYKNSPGFNDAVIYTALASASGNDISQLGNPFDYLVYFKDDVDVPVINGTVHSTNMGMIKDYCRGNRDNISQAKINELSASLEHIFKDIVAEIRYDKASGLKDSMSDIIMNYNVSGEIRTPEADIIVGFMNKESFERFYNALESKEYLSVCKIVKYF